MKRLFGAAIAVVLLGLYVYAVGEAIRIALSDDAGVLKPGFANAMNTIGGLVSALVIAELAITKPGKQPAARMLPSDTGATANKVATFVAIGYVAIWILLGLAAFVIGVMLHDGKVQALTDLGAAWLGLAVAAGYAYFGLSRAS